MLLQGGICHSMQREQQQLILISSLEIKPVLQIRTLKKVVEGAKWWNDCLEFHREHVELPNIDAVLHSCIIIDISEKKCLIDATKMSD